MYFLNKVDIFPKHFICTGEKLFSLRKGLKWIPKTVQKKCIKKCTKSYFIAQIFMSIIKLFFFCFISLVFDCKWKLKYFDFVIIKTLFQILHVFVLLNKDKVKVQHESATSLFCTNMLHFYVALFLRRSKQLFSF